MHFFIMNFRYIYLENHHKFLYYLDDIFLLKISIKYQNYILHSAIHYLYFKWLKRRQIYLFLWAESDSCPLSLSLSSLSLDEEDKSDESLEELLDDEQLELSEATPVSCFKSILSAIAANSGSSFCRNERRILLKIQLSWFISGQWFL